MASSAWLAAQAIRNRRPAVTWAAVPGALCIIGAAVNGASFLDYNNNVNSYLMALLFAAAVHGYAVILALPPAQNDQTPYFAASPDTQKAKSAPSAS